MSKESPPPVTTSQFKSLILAVAGAVGILGLGLISVFVSAEVQSILTDKRASEIAIMIVSGFAAAVFILASGILLSLVFEKPVISYLKSSARNLDLSTTTNLETSSTASSTINTLHDQVSDLKAEIEKTIEGSHTINNIGKTVLFGSYGEIQSQFLDIVEKPNEKELKIIGTMLGAFGDESISIAEQLYSYSIRDTNELPFKTASFGVPGHITEKEFDSSYDPIRCLYPISARITAIDILSKFVASQDPKPLRRKLGGKPLAIDIYFANKIDIFPAIQIWGQESAMVICSTGADDRFSGDMRHKAISETMQVAMVIQKEVHLSGKSKTPYLGESLERIDKMIANDYFNNTPHERWSIDPSTLKISVKNYISVYEEHKFLEYAERAYGKASEFYKELKETFKLFASSHEFQPEQALRASNALIEATEKIISENS